MLLGLAKGADFSPRLDSSFLHPRQVSHDSMPALADPTDAHGSDSWTTAGAGITGAYNGDDSTFKIFIVFFAGLAMYNSFELVFMCFFGFKRYRGLYFWSMLLSSFGIFPYSLGFLIKYMNWTTGNLKWLAVFFLTIGWYPMITGQALVLWSRLHLIIHGERGEKIMFWTKWMIIVNAICLHIPTTVLTMGSNGDLDTDRFVYAYMIMEKLQMCGFFVQETVLSGIYIVETSKILRNSLQNDTRKTMEQLVLINVIIVIMDLGLLGLVSASLYILETLVKGIVYSIKLKLEFAILGKLVKFVGGTSASPEEAERKSSVGFVQTHGKATSIDNNLDPSEFVDLRRLQTNHTHATTDRSDSTQTSVQKRQGPHGMDFEYDFARFEHVEDVTTLGGSSSSVGSSRERRGEV